MSEFSRPAKELLDASREYADSKADEVKLQVVKGLSISLSKLVSMLIIVCVGMALLLVLSFGLILLLGDLMGKRYGLAAISVAVVLAVAFLILYIRRDQLLRNTFVPVFMKLFFPVDEDDNDGKESEVQGDPDAGEA
ncbi:MAG: hypothetical protein J6W09_00710 [Bacteroidales bacterium]|jgi:hypothetical protein|nr:hypothetical protein [Bacteroidales bacterium]